MGGGTPCCLAVDRPGYGDSGIMSLDYVSVGGGSRSAEVKIDPEVFNKMPSVRVIEGLAN